MIKIYKFMIMLVSVGLVITALAISAFADPDQAVLTLMVYVTGSDLESTSGAATSDITEMMRSGVDTEKVNIILCTGGAKRWQGGFPNDHVCIYRVEGRRPRQLESFDLVSMGEASTLTTFLNYSYENFSADQYALILWDHGGGPMNGVCFDELFSKNKTHDSLDLSELRTALSDSPFNQENPLEWIGFDACLMSSVETAYICAPYARYMIASQETEPGTGWDYSYLKRASEGLCGDEMGKLIVERYTDDSHASELMLTLSCIDLSQLENVEAAMNVLFENLDNMLSPEHFSEISNGRRDAKSFGRASTGSEYDLVDLFSLAEQYKNVESSRAQALQNALENAIVIHKGNQESSHGLSVYYPYYNKGYYKELWKKQYSMWEFAEGYYEFMNHYADLWLGDQLADWSDVRAAALPALPEGQEITLPLTQDQIGNFAFAQLYIIGRMFSSDPYYYKIDEIDDVELDNAGVLHGNYNYKALYAVDENGNPLCDAIPYRIVDGYYLIRANLTDKTWETYRDEALSIRDLKFNDDANIEARKVYLQCVPNAVGDGLDVVGVIDMRDHLSDDLSSLFVEGEGLFMGKQSITIDMDEWNWVWFFHFPRELQQDSEGNVFAFDDWPNPNLADRLALEWEEIDNNMPWKLEFQEQQYTGRDIYAQYILHDTQGNLTGSNLIPVNNPNLIMSMEMDETLYSSDDFTLTIKEIELKKAEYNDGIYLHFDLEDLRQNPNDIVINVGNVVLNRCLLDNRYSMSIVPKSDGNMEYVLVIPTKDIPDMLEDTLRSICFDVRIYDPSSTDDLDEFSVVLKQEIDISTVHTFTPDKHILAEAQVDDVLYRLTGIEEDDKKIKLTLIVDNMGCEKLDHSWTNSAVVNGYEWQDAVENQYFTIPADCWMMAEVEVYKKSYSEDSFENLYGIPQYSYTEHWGISAIDRIEFTDWNNEVVSFKLEEPYLLKHEGNESSLAIVENNASLTLLDTEDICVKLTGISLREESLRLIVDVENNSDKMVKILPQYASVNNTPCDCSLETLDDLFSISFTPEEILPGQHKRLAYMIKPEISGASFPDIDTIGLGFEYIPEGDEVWNYCSPATIRFNEPKSFEEIGNMGYSMENISVVDEGLLMENEPVDPISLVDVAWNAPGDISAYQTTLRIALSDTQMQEIENATVLLMLPYKDSSEDVGAVSGVEDLCLVTALASVRKDNGGMLACDFNGLLIGIDGMEMPIVQYYTSTEDGYLYELKTMQLYTDHADLSENSIWFDQLSITINLAENTAKTETVKLDRAVGSAEKMTTLECWSVLFTYTDGTGSVMEQTGIMVGDEYKLDGELIHLLIRSADDYDPIVVFYIKNKDGSKYTVQTTYQEASCLSGDE